MLLTTRRVGGGPSEVLSNEVNGASTSSTRPPEGPAALGRRSQSRAGIPNRVSQTIDVNRSRESVADASLVLTRSQLATDEQRFMREMDIYLAGQSYFAPITTSARRTVHQKVMDAYRQSSPKLVITGLPIEELPRCLKYLIALRHFDVTGNQLLGLPTLPPNLEILQAASNNLSELPRVLPPNLTFLGLDNNNFDEICAPPFAELLLPSYNDCRLPATLLTLSARGNRLRRIRALPQNLHTLRADHNEMIDLPDLPDSLTYLSVSNNQLTELTFLRALPESLRELDISYNKLAYLPESFASTLKYGLVELSNNNWSESAKETLHGMYAHTIMVDDKVNWNYGIDFRGEHVKSPPRFASPPWSHSYRRASALSNFYRNTRGTEAGPTTQIIEEWEQCRNKDCPAIFAMGGPRIQEALLTANAIAGARIREAILNDATSLDLRELGLRSLPKCLYRMESLEVLEVQGNFIEKIPRLPPKLVTLKCSRNRLTALPYLPDTIQTIWARGNLITRIKKLPESLRELLVDHNRLTKLPNLPPLASHISVSNNYLSFFPQMQFADTNFTIDISFNRIRNISHVRPPPGTAGYLRITERGFDPAEMGRLISMPQTIFVAGNSSRLNMDTSVRRDVRLTRRQRVSSAEELYAASRAIEIAEYLASPAAPHNPYCLRRTIAQFTPVVESPSETVTQGPLDLTAPLTEPSLLEFSTRVGLHCETTVDLSLAITKKMFAEAESSLDGTPEQVAMRDSIKPWLLDPSDIKQIVDWIDCADEPDAQLFAEFLNRLRETREYQLPAYQGMLKRRVNDLVIEMINQPKFRELCFTIAREATQTCGDRVALTLNDVKSAHINFKAEHGRYKIDDLFDLAEGMFKLSILDEIAAEHVIMIKDANPWREQIDEVEVRLGFQTLLAEKLRLPGVARAMLYAGCADISEQDLENAQMRVEHRVARSGSLEFVSRWLPWELAMKRAYPEKYAPVDREIEERRGGLAWAPALTNDQTYIEELKELSQFENEQFAIAAIEATSDYLKHRASKVVRPPVETSTNE